MAENIYTAPNDYRAFCDMVETYNSMTHHGIKGQKWGERRFQYNDGSLTAAGKARYGGGDGKRKAVFKESGKAWERASSHEKATARKTNAKAYAMQDAKAAYKAKKKAFKQHTSEKAKEMNNRVDEVWKIKDKKKRDAAAQELDKHFDRLWNETNKSREGVKAAKQEYKNAKKELNNDVAYAKKKAFNKTAAIAAAGVAATLATALATKDIDKTTYAKNAAIGATAIAAVLGRHSVKNAKRATDPSGDFRRKSIKNASARELTGKEKRLRGKILGGAALGLAGAGAAAVGAKKYGGLTTDTGKKLIGVGAGLAAAGYLKSANAQQIQRRIDKRRKQLNKK